MSGDEKSEKENLTAEELNIRYGMTTEALRQLQDRYNSTLPVLDPVKKRK